MIEDDLFIMEYNLNEFSTIESNKKLRFEGEEPNIRSLRNSHKAHKETPQITSKMDFLEAGTRILPIQEYMSRM